MKLQVSQAQARAWQHPLVLELQEALKTMTHDFHLKARVSDIILTRGLMTSFLTMPFTVESAEGKRLTLVLEDLKKELPNSILVQDFHFRFWKPVADTLEAAFIQGAIKQEPVLVGAYVA